MNLARSIVHGFVGPCKTESSQKHVPDPSRRRRSFRQIEVPVGLSPPVDWVFCQPAQRWKTSVLWTSDSAQVPETSSSKSRNRKAVQLAQVPAHLLHPFEKLWHRVQGNAGVAATLDHTLNSRRLHASDHTGQTECSSSGDGVGLLFSVKLKDHI